MVVLACQQGLQIDSLPRNWLPCRNHTVIAVEPIIVMHHLLRYGIIETGVASYKYKEIEGIQSSFVVLWVLRLLFLVITLVDLSSFFFFSFLFDIFVSACQDPYHPSGYSATLFGSLSTVATGSWTRGSADTTSSMGAFVTTYGAIHLVTATFV